MVDQLQIDEWKAKYRNVYLVEFQDEDFVFRSLTLGEFSAVQDVAQESNVDAEECIVRAALLHPDLGDTVPAGLWSSLASEILDISYFNAPGLMKRVVITKREQSNNLPTQIKAFIIAAIPTYNDYDLDNMTFDQLADRVILAEQIIKVQQASAGIEDSDLKLEIIDPAEEAAKAKKDAAKHASTKEAGAAGVNDPIAAKLWAAMGKG